MAPNMETAAAAAAADDTKAATTHVANAHLHGMDCDVLYHLGLSYTREEQPQLAERFGDVRFFVTGGSADRMTKFAHEVAHELGLAPPFGYALAPVGTTKRYTMYKVGPVLVANHGMGMPSASILLHEVTKLLHYAGARNATYIRFGTSGGVGVAPGTVVISSEGVNNHMESIYEVAVLGSTQRRPALCSPHVRDALSACAQELDVPFAVGKTLACNDFYEGQGRLDGAICDYTKEDKMAFLRTCEAAGVKNIEMEATCVAAFCHKLQIPVAIVCVTLLNRLEGDQVRSSPETLQGFETRPSAVLLHYIKKTLQAEA